jgi:hypothetical protein
MPDPNRLRFSNRNKLAATAAAGALAFTLGLRTGENQAAAAAPNAKSSPEIAEKNPLFEHTNQRLKTLVARMRKMVKDDNPAIYHQKTTYNHQKVVFMGVSERYFDSDADKYLYDQFVAVVAPGKKLPEWVALLHAAPDTDFHPVIYNIGVFLYHDAKPEQSYRMEQWVHAEKHPRAVYNLKNSTPIIDRRYPKIEFEFNRFTNEAKRIIDVAIQPKNDQEGLTA